MVALKPRQQNLALFEDAQENHCGREVVCALRIRKLLLLNECEVAGVQIITSSY